MFIKNLNKFKKNVEDTIYEFFSCTPEELKNYLKFITVRYPEIEWDNVAFSDVQGETKDELCKYKTAKYFIRIYDKLLELQEIMNDNTGI